MKRTITRLDHSKKMFSYTNWESIKDIINDEMRHKFSPILTLDLTEKCNYNCKYCIDKKNMNKKDACELDWKKLKELLPEIKQKGCRAIELSGGGEPTLYTHFADFVFLASQLGFRISLITNGSQLHKYKQAIICSNFDWVRVSIDAASQDKFSYFHSVKNIDIDMIFQSIFEISKEKVIGVSYIVSEDNYDEIYEAALKAKKYGAKYIEFKPMLNEKRQLISYDSIKDHIVEELNNSFSLNDDYFTVITTQSLNLLLNKVIVSEKCYSHCYSCYIRTVLTPRGVYPCSYFRESDYRVSKCISCQDIIDARNKLICRINPAMNCKHYCARNEMNLMIDNISRFFIEYPQLIDNIGWPFDYGEDWLWF